ncbi:MAG: hypothetical protein KBD24_01835 [Candidatus Pacebacteria bacterium]|nr:hypothetical protein [Candidatus Paceibacterota bacterium]
MSNFKRTGWSRSVGALILYGVLGVATFLVCMTDFSPVTYSRQGVVGTSTVVVTDPKEVALPSGPTPLDIVEYDRRLLALSGYIPPEPVVATTTRPDGTIATTTKVISDLRYASTTNVTVKGKLWPPSAPYPNSGAILPFARILAYYGNLYSTRMGILGELPSPEMLAKLQRTVDLWNTADPATPVLPAIEYIAIVAQESAGADGMYRAVMPDTEIDKAYALAQEANGIFILDLQVGKSTIQKELPQFKHYLERPDVHLAIDPEFSMKTGKLPGTVVGTYDATDINYVIEFLATIVRENHLPPKVLVVHRFTQNMVTNATLIKPRPEVQFVMHMDGWGSKERKRGTYNHILVPEPVQFMGIKIFYKNDLKSPSTGILTPEEVLTLNPKPIYIQYQ